jgi:hypothetical protein
MRQYIPHGQNMAPRHVRVAPFQAVIQILGCLANLQNPIGRRVLNIRVVQKFFSREAGRLPLDTADQSPQALAF